jgi:dUTPase
VLTNDVIIRNTCSRLRVITVENSSHLASKKGITNLLGLLDPAYEGIIFETSVQ